MSSKELTSEKMLEIIQKCSSDGLFIVSDDGTIVFLNDAYEEITGQNAASLIGKNANNLKNMNILETSVFECVNRSHQATSMMLNYIRSNKNALVTAVPVFRSDGSYFAMLGNIRDLSNLNSLEHELEQTKKRVKVVQEELAQIRGKAKMGNAYIAKSPAMRSLTILAQRISAVDANVLITGESGVGKGVYARLIRNLTIDGLEKPFIKISCGAIPDNLLESELFGYSEGAFTGARKGGKPGAFELAGNGIIFLDEIGEMPLHLQVKLLTVLQDREFTPVGGTRPIKMNARIIAATNKNLIKEVLEGRFRKDLYYRLNVIPVDIPPLRERKEDILPLANVILKNLNSKYGKSKKFSTSVFKKFERYSWPGNARELVNVVERMAALCPDDLIDDDYLPASFDDDIAYQDMISSYSDLPLKEYVEQMEIIRIKAALNKPQSFSEAAKELNIDQSTLTRRIQRYNLKQRHPKKLVHEHMSNIRID